MGGVSGWQIGKSQGAKGWGMFGYIAGGAALGGFTSGGGSTVSAATVSWGTVGSGISSGAFAGATAGGFGSAMAGGDFLQGAGKGALFGGVFGGVGSYLNKAYTDWSLDRNMLSQEYALAQNGPGPKYMAKPIADVIITAKRNVANQLSLAGQARADMIGAFAASATFLSSPARGDGIYQTFGIEDVLGGAIAKRLVSSSIARMSSNVISKAYSHSFKYSDKVRIRALQDPRAHNFPYSFDDLVLKSDPILKNSGYRIFQHPGTMSGKNGFFEIGVTKNGIIDHRVFKVR